MTPEHQELFDANVRLAHFIAGRWLKNFPGAEPDEMHQAALIGLWQAVESFDPALGTPFAAFAGTCIRHELAKLRRDRLADRLLTNVEDCLTADGDAVSIFDALAAEAQARPDDARAARLAEVRQLLAHPEPGLFTPREIQVLRLLFVEGLSSAEAKDRLGASAQSLSNPYRRAVEKLRRRLQSAGTWKGTMNRASSRTVSYPVEPLPETVSPWELT